MIRFLVLLHLAERSPVPIAGRTLHRAGLHALAGGHPMHADRLFECAARSYRRDLDVERLARLRVHQSIARYRAGGPLAGGEEASLGIERALCRLGRIESLVSPFELVDARRLLAHWMSDHGARRDAAAA